jgi:hypothetical protein
MIVEIESKMNLNDHIRHPRLSWNVPEICRIHKELYPLSRLGRIVFFLRLCAIAGVITSILVGLLSMHAR